MARKSQDEHPPALVYKYREDGSPEPIDEDIRYLRATSADGSTWGTPVVVTDNTWDPDDIRTMTIIDGNPAFCFEWDDGDNAVYCRAIDATGSAWGEPEIAGPLNWVVYDETCLAEINGLPAIAYARRIDETGSGHSRLEYVIKIQ